MAEEKYNLKNPSVKRILQEFREAQSNPSDDFMSLPLEVCSISKYIIYQVCVFVILFFSFFIGEYI